MTCRLPQPSSISIITTATTLRSPYQAHIFVPKWHLSALGQIARINRVLSSRLVCGTRGTHTSVVDACSGTGPRAHDIGVQLITDIAKSPIRTTLNRFVLALPRNLVSSLISRPDSSLIQSLLIVISTKTKLFLGCNHVSPFERILIPDVDSLSHTETRILNRVFCRCKPLH